MTRKKTEQGIMNLIDFYRRFPTEESCREYLKNERFPDGKVACPKCGSMEKIYSMADGKRYKCGNKGCFHIFTITVGTIFEASHIPLQKWFLAIYVVSAHKKGISSLQLHRDIGVMQKSAWFMLHRIRYMLANGVSAQLMKGTVEIDETYVGGKTHGKGSGYMQGNKTPVFGMIERNGELRTEVVKHADGKTLKPIIRENVSRDAVLMSDEFGGYKDLNKEYKDHKIVIHSKKQYVKGIAHTNTIEGFWSLLKRGIFGIYHYVSPEHLQAYCDEFEYRYNTRKIEDGQRFKKVLGQTEGRLTYKELIAQ
jgi:transposase-like protein